VAYGTLNEITYLLLIKCGFKNTLFLNHLYVAVATLFLGLFYREVFRGFIRKNIIHSVIFSLEVYAIVNVLFLHTVFEYPSLLNAIYNMLFLLASIVFFYKTMIEAKIKNLCNEPLVWFNSAILIYYSGSLFYSVLFNLVLEYSIEFSRLIVLYFAVLNALFYLFIAIGFMKTPTAKRLK
jgi:hypothetical protein